MPPSIDPQSAPIPTGGLHAERRAAGGALSVDVADLNAVTATNSGRQVGAGRGGARWKIHVTAAVGLVVSLTLVSAATAQPPAAVGVEVSAGVSWMPYGPTTRPVGVRALNAAEVRLARQRAADIYRAFRASPFFNTPRDRAHLATSSAALEPIVDASSPTRGQTLQQSITPY